MVRTKRHKVFPLPREVSLTRTETLIYFFFHSLYKKKKKRETVLILFYQYFFPGFFFVENIPKVSRCLFINKLPFSWNDPAHVCILSRFALRGEEKSSVAPAGRRRCASPPRKSRAPPGPKIPFLSLPRCVPLSRLVPYIGNKSLPGQLGAGEQTNAFSPQ